VILEERRLKMNRKSPIWHHPGGKLRELGAETLTATFKETKAVNPIKVR
jgi:hypothetical protein